jgi:hypothetical protein
MPIIKNSGEVNLIDKGADTIGACSICTKLLLSATILHALMLLSKEHVIKMSCPCTLVCSMSVI